MSSLKENNDFISWIVGEEFWNNYKLFQIESIRRRIYQTDVVYSKN